MLDTKPAQLFANYSAGTQGPRRNRQFLAAISGPGVLTDLWMVIGPTNVIGDGWNIYAASTPLSDLTDNAATTDLEGMPLIPTDLKLRGCLLVAGCVLSGPSHYPLNLAIPPGAWYLYTVSVYLNGGVSGFTTLARYVQL